MSANNPERILHFRRSTLLAIGIGLFIIGGVIGSLATAMSGRGPFGIDRVPVLVASASPVPAGSVSIATGFNTIVEKTKPGVVNISSTKIVRTHNPMAPMMNDPFFRQFFGPFQDIPREQRERSLGSGVIVNPDGYVLTNNHVVEGATDIEVALSDRRILKAKIIGTDPQTDVAVVKVDAKNLPVLVFGDSSGVRVGDVVLAAGDPFGIGQTFTMGIVSATGRGGFGIEHYEDFIQTDAAINPGNSGGALVNVKGELIGINTAIISGGGGNQGVGFAIPVNMARHVMDQIIKQGKVVRGWLGVAVQPVTPAIASGFGLKQASGALISEVTKDSPAQKAGLQRGDVVLELNGKPVTDSRDLSLKISEMSPGSTANLKVFRNGSQRDVAVKLGEAPANASAEKGNAPNGGSSALQGLSVDRLTPDIAQQLGLPRDTRGVVVSEVQPGSPADDAGLRQGDVIQEVNHKSVTDVDGFRQAVNAAGTQPLVLLVNRGGNNLYVVVQHP